MSAPGSLAIAKIMYPELERSKFEQTVAKTKVKDRKHNLFYAILEGLFLYALACGDIGDSKLVIEFGQQHLQFVTNTFCLQHPSPISMYPIWLKPKTFPEKFRYSTKF